MKPQEKNLIPLNHCVVLSLPCCSLPITSFHTFSIYDIYAKHPSIDSPTSMCDQHSSATTYSKQQSYPTQSPIERTTRKRPHLLSYRSHLLGGRRLAHGLMSIFTVCSTLLRLCKEPLVRSWNYTYRNIIINSPTKSSCIDISSWKDPPVARFSLANN